MRFIVYEKIEARGPACGGYMLRPGEDMRVFENVSRTVTLSIKYTTKSI